jgi:hypothetical protein
MVGNVEVSVPGEDGNGVMRFMLFAISSNSLFYQKQQYQHK